jgi:hypothetical protein
MIVKRCNLIKRKRSVGIMEISKVNIVQNVAIQVQAAVESVPAPQPVIASNQAVPQQIITPQAPQMQQNLTQQAVNKQAETSVTQKKGGDKNSASSAKKYYTAYDLKTATGMSSDVLKLNDELRNIAKQNFQYQSDIDEIKKEIDNDGSDPAKRERDTVELNLLKTQLSEADIERTRKLNEIRAKYAEGTYKVNSRDVVNSWD